MLRAKCCSITIPVKAPPAPPIISVMITSPAVVAVYTTPVITVVVVITGPVITIVVVVIIAAVSISVTVVITVTVAVWGG
jgi:hypothetical protein